MDGERRITAEFPAEIVSIFQELSDRLKQLDVSIDYLTAAITGEDPLGIGAAQSFGGRLASPSRKGRRLEPEE